MFSKLFLMRSNVNKPLGILPPLTPPEDWGGIRVLLFLILASSAFAQPFPPDSVWTFAFDDGGDEYFYDAIEVSDGYLLCGEAREWNAMAGEALIVKIDRQGRIVWSRRAETAPNARFVQFRGVVTDGTGFIAEEVSLDGQTTRIVEVSMNLNTLDIVWNAPVVECFEGCNWGSFNYFWNYNIAYSTQIPGHLENLAIDIRMGEDRVSEIMPSIYSEHCEGGCVSGYENTASFWIFGKARALDRPDYDGVAVRAWNGTSVQPIRFVIGGFGNDSFYDGTFSSDHSVTLVGVNSFGTSPQSDLYLLKFDNSTVDSLWSRHYGGLSYEDGVEIFNASDNGFIIAGNFSSEDIEFEQSDYWLLKVGENGDSVWSVVKGGDEADRCEGMIQTENGFLLFGASQSFAVPGWDGCAMYLAYVPDIAAAPGSLNFGPVAVGLTATRTLGLINTGSNVLTVTEIQGSGDYSTAFTGPATVEIGDTLRVDILFTPQSVGNHVDTLRIFSDAISGVKTVRCLGAGTAANADEESLLPTEFKLHPPYPNPFNPTTTIAFDVPKTQSVALNLYDVSGRLVRELVQQEFAAGRQRVSIDGKEMASGIYFVSMVSGEFQAAQKLVLMK